ncbi:hypothetical protein [Novosphingobium resinovorum]|uniref:hypothetical protein n=1 Tax=Novosphingobium resinovorum TaxID=158500 RepID=UPI002ED52CD6|nr:hypothetical protein [Novosphingobium resinovorum]
MIDGRSNRARGEANYVAISEYFERVGSKIPRRHDGSADIARIVDEVPLSSRGIIYQNSRNRDLCNHHFRLQGIAPIGTREDPSAGASLCLGEPSEEQTRQLKRKIDQLERELAVARGEVLECRKALRRFGAIERHVAETGRLPR